MVNFIRLVVIETLRATGKPKLIALADWISDAETTAVKLIAKTISQSIRANGIITNEAERTILDVKNSPPQISPTDWPNSRTPFLDEYLELLEYIVSVGSRRERLLLQGFIHSSECSTLWIFEGNVDPHLEIQQTLLQTKPHITVSGANLEIRLLDKMTDDDISRLNTELGRNTGTLPSELRSEDAPQVLTVFEDVVELSVPKTVKKKAYIREKGVRKTIEVDKTEWANEEERIDKTNHSGVQEMVHSLPIAIVAREAALTKLKDILRPQPPQ